MQRSRSYPVARELIMGTESMVRIALLKNFETSNRCKFIAIYFFLSIDVLISETYFAQRR